VLAVIGDGLSVSQVAEKVGVSRHARSEGLKDRSHRPMRRPHKMGAEAAAHSSLLGPRRLVFELAKRVTAHFTLICLTECFVSDDVEHLRTSL
jgi:hypothetical protein